MKSFIIIAVLLITAICRADDVEVSVDGRFGSKCPGSGEPLGGELCQVSFYRLLAQPEQYHERRVLLRGHLIKFLDRYVLFPSREAFETGSDLDGVEVWVDTEMENQLVDLPRSGTSGYGVIGTFDARFPGSGISRLGRLSNVRLLGPRYRVDDRPPPPPVQDGERN
jgi:hypothetical protein